MNIAVIGTGYVGLVTGTCLAAEGNNVTCVDIDSKKIETLRKGVTPIYEPGLEELLKENIKDGRISFSSDLSAAVKSAHVVFLALPTPEAEDGSADLSYILQVAKQLGPLIKKYTIIVDKSTVPVGTSELVRQEIIKSGGEQSELDVVSNPEFLKEGHAISDFMKPDRVVIGTSSDKAWDVMKRLYKPFVLDDESKLIRMTEASAEITKYAANAMLAARISFMNSIANICELAGADVREVQKGIGSDSRIGHSFLHAGPGYGGSCFPKDVQALWKTSTSLGYDFPILAAVHQTNERQKQKLAELVKDHYRGELKGKVIALWGLAFKPNTDDIREAPALELINVITKAGAKVVAFDPEATDNVKRHYGDHPSLEFALSKYEALTNADALVIVTEWDEFKTLDYKRLKTELNKPVIFDGRSLYDLDEMSEQGIHYVSIGRPVVNG